MTPADDSSPLYVVSSEIRVDPVYGDGLVDAFRGRVGLVDGWPGFDHLEVWREHGDVGRFVMNSWWSSPDAFRGYMRSAEHRASHARIPAGPARPRAAGVTRFELVAR